MIALDDCHAIADICCVDSVVDKIADAATVLSGSRMKCAVHV